MRKATAAIVGTLAGTVLLTVMKLGTDTVSLSTATADPPATSVIGGAASAAPPATSACPAAFTSGGVVVPVVLTDDGDDGGQDGGEEDGDDDQGTVTSPTDTATIPAAPAPSSTDSASAAPTGSATSVPSCPATATPTSGGTSAAPSSPAASSAGTGLKDGTFKGTASTNEYGTIQTSIIVSGGRITDVTASFPTTPARTSQINTGAIPALRQEAVTAQSATIDSVSGASFTSASYKTSLQSAIDAAKA